MDPRETFGTGADFERFFNQVANRMHSTTPDPATERAEPATAEKPSYHARERTPAWAVLGIAFAGLMTVVSLLAGGLWLLRSAKPEPNPAVAAVHGNLSPQSTPQAPPNAPHAPQSPTGRSAQEQQLLRRQLDTLGVRARDLLLGGRWRSDAAVRRALLTLLDEMEAIAEQLNQPEELQLIRDCRAQIMAQTQHVRR